MQWSDIRANWIVIVFAIGAIGHAYLLQYRVDKLEEYVITHEESNRMYIEMIYGNEEDIEALEAENRSLSDVLDEVKWNLDFVMCRYYGVSEGECFLKDPWAVEN